MFFSFCLFLTLQVMLLKNLSGQMNLMEIRSDYSKWGVEENAYGGGNNEQQIYRWDKKNLRVEGGNLIIQAHNDKPNVAGTSRLYSSARIRTKHRGLAILPS